LYDVIALDRWINDKNHSFCIIDDETKEIVLIAMLHLEKRICNDDEIYRLHSRWGYVIKDGLTHKQEKKVCDKYKEYIDSIYDQYSIQSFNAAMPPLTEKNWPDNLDAINPLMKLGFSPSIRYTWITVIEDEESQLAKCEQTTRQAIRKWKKSEQYEVVEGENCEEHYQIYKSIHEETYTRTGAANAIIYEEYNRNIFFNLLPQRRARIFFLKDKMQERIVAAVVILLYKNTGYYWWGGSIDEREVGINKYLLWEAMITVSKEYKQHPDFQYPIYDSEHFYFEAGGAYTYARSGKTKGLNDFKKCFGCKLHPIYTGMYVRE